MIKIIVCERGFTETELITVVKIETSTSAC